MKFGAVQWKFKLGVLSIFSKLSSNESAKKRIHASIAYKCVLVNSLHVCFSLYPLFSFCICSFTRFYTAYKNEQHVSYPLDFGAFQLKLMPLGPFWMIVMLPQWHFWVMDPWQKQTKHKQTVLITISNREWSSRRSVSLIRVLLDQTCSISAAWIHSMICSDSLP